MASYECRDCDESTSAPPGNPPAGWTPQWLEEPDFGAYTFSVLWCCPHCSDQLADFRPPKLVCGSCYEGYSKHPATAVHCPDCGSNAGAPCLRPSGHEYWGGGVHAMREQLALDEGKMRMCPEGITARRSNPYIDDHETAAAAGLVETPAPTLF